MGNVISFESREGRENNGNRIPDLSQESGKIISLGEVSGKQAEVHRLIKELVKFFKLSSSSLPSSDTFPLYVFQQFSTWLLQSITFDESQQKWKFRRVSTLQTEGFTYCLDNSSRNNQTVVDLYPKEKKFFLSLGSFLNGSEPYFETIAEMDKIKDQMQENTSSILKGIFPRKDEKQDTNRYIQKQAKAFLEQLGLYLENPDIGNGISKMPVNQRIDDVLIPEFLLEKK